MQEKTRLTFLGIFYTLVLALLIETFLLARIAQFVAEKLFPQNGSMVSFLPSFVFYWISFLVSISASYLIIKKIQLERLTHFLKPTMFKVAFVIFTQLLFIAMVAIDQWGLISISNHFVSQLALRTIMYGEMFPFANPLITIIIYYLFGCVISWAIFERQSPRP